MSNLDNSIPLKRCTKCGRNLPESPEYFDRHRKGKHGLVAYCKDCKAIQRGTKHRKIKEHLPDGLKRCSKCGKVLPATREYFFWQQKRGVRQPCLECMDNIRHHYLDEYPDRRKKSANEWYYRNRDQRRAYVAFRMTAEQKQRHDDYLREYRKVNPELVRQRQRLSRQRRPYVYQAITARRTARKHKLPDTFTASDWVYALSYFRGCCAICGRPPGLWHTIAADHWIPLASPDCPGTVPTNILPLCHGIDGCNNSKHDQDPVTWLHSKLGDKQAKQKLLEIERYFASLSAKK